MSSPRGISPTLPQDASPTALLSSAVASIGVTFPSPSSTLDSTLSIATAISSSLSEPSTPDNGECRLLGPFAILIQGSLGLLALLALVYKRWRERPQRPVKIWFFDVSKQVFGSVLVHIANLLMSMLSSGQFSIRLDPSAIEGRGLAGLAKRIVDEEGKYMPNPCSFYLLNLAIDTTVGIPILILLLRILTALFALTSFGAPRESIASGNYGRPPKAWWWFKQSMIYFLGLMGMKLCVLILFIVAPWISRVGDWALRWTEGDEALQVVFVMLVFPVIMNATQYYIIDSFIKNPAPEHELLPDGDEEADDTYEDPSSVYGEEIQSGGGDEDVEIRIKAGVEAVAVKSKRTKNKGEGGGSGSKSLSGMENKDYDPQFDGESSPTMVGSASTKGTDRTLVSRGETVDGGNRFGR